jgi:hypothetical protein
MEKRNSRYKPTRVSERMLRLRQVFLEHSHVPLSVPSCHLTHMHTFCTVLVPRAALNSHKETHISLPNAALQTQKIYKRTLRFFKSQLNIATSVSMTTPVLHDRRTAVQFPAATRLVSLLQTVQTGSGAHADSCSRGAGRSFSG